MTDEKKRLMAFYDAADENVRRCALVVGALYLDLIKETENNGGEIDRRRIFKDFRGGDEIASTTISVDCYCVS